MIPLLYVLQTRHVRSLLVVQIFQGPGGADAALLENTAVNAFQFTGTFNMASASSSEQLINTVAEMGVNMLVGCERDYRYIWSSNRIYSSSSKLMFDWDSNSR